ncbi:hypothetical protein HOM13_00490 [Candidatus Woesearchaeota archaeon]|jgi:hypothetical protein|nr:hypothetical protein [Candidatus Woesearchaeota archaeon]MBT5215196.1 hypothetical protein [Candidatus Woesearchaeota archaeon]MBT6402313.1 hypothetical protein [Candidatus Woesearchaeota archaeon]
MAIRGIQNEDFEKLVRLYKSFFNTHNIFQKSEKEIIDYLKEQSEENALIVYDETNSIVGALFLVNFGQNENGSHKLWKFRHFAFQTKEVAQDLLEEAEKIVKNSSETSKIELTLAESEKEIEFYKSNKYILEGTLSNHYRPAEACFILSKCFS